MRAARQPAEKVLNPNKPQGVRPSGAVKGRPDKGAAGANQFADSREERIAIGDVLDNFESEDSIELMLLAHQFFSACDTVIDREASFFGVRAGDRDRRCGCIDAG